MIFNEMNSRKDECGRRKSDYRKINNLLFSHFPSSLKSGGGE